MFGRALQVLQKLFFVCFVMVLYLALCAAIKNVSASVWWTRLQGLVTAVYVLWYGNLLKESCMSTYTHIMAWLQKIDLPEQELQDLTRRVYKKDGYWVFGTCLMLSVHHFVVAHMLGWPCKYAVLPFGLQTVLMFGGLFCGLHQLFDGHLKLMGIFFQWCENCVLEKNWPQPSVEAMRHLEDFILEERFCRAVCYSHMAFLNTYHNVHEELRRIKADITKNKNTNPRTPQLRQKLDELDKNKKVWTHIETNLFTAASVFWCALPIVVVVALLYGVYVYSADAAEMAWAFALKCYRAHHKASVDAKNKEYMKKQLEYLASLKEQ
jgi:hypothetical protein